MPPGTRFPGPVRPHAAVEVAVDGARRTVTGPACLTIEAGKYHAVRALTDAVWYCIHATDCTDPAQVDEVVIAKDSDPHEGMRAALAAVNGGI